METCFNYIDRDRAYFSSDEKKWVLKIRKLAAKYPEDVRVIAEPEKNNNCIYVELPANWLRIQPKQKVDLTEEQRQALRERMLNIRKDYPQT